METTEPVIWEKENAPNTNYRWVWRCTGCEIEESSTYNSRGSAAYAVKRHRQSNRHLGKVAPAGGQKAQQTTLYEATLRDMTAKQAAELAGLISKWIAEEGKGVH